MWVALAILTVSRKPIGCRSLLQRSNMSIASNPSKSRTPAECYVLTIVQTLVIIT